MRTTGMAALGAALAFAAATVRADVSPPMPESYETAGDLASACAMPAATSRAQFCLGYAVGIADTLPAAAPDGRGRCGPRGIVSAQLVEIVRDWIAAHEAVRDRPAAAAVADALADRFPCGRPAGR